MARTVGSLTSSSERISDSSAMAWLSNKVRLVPCHNVENDATRLQGGTGRIPLSEGDKLALDGNAKAVHPGQSGVSIVRPEAAQPIIVSCRRAAAA